MLSVSSKLIAAWSMLFGSGTPGINGRLDGLNGPTTWPIPGGSEQIGTIKFSFKGAKQTFFTPPDRLGRRHSG
jgi:hypothetical protein